MKYIIILLLCCLSAQAHLPDGYEMCGVDDNNFTQIKFQKIELEPGPILASVGEKRFGRWAPGEVHVKITDKTNSIDEFTKQELIAHTLQSLAEIDLDIQLVFDDNTNNGGINITYDYYDTHWCGNTQRVAAFNLNDTPVFRPSIKINANCIDAFPEGNNKTNGFKNTFLHEMLHALFVDHIKVIKPMPVALMNPYVSTDRTYWTYNDQQKLLELYGHKYKILKFSEEDIGKTAFIIYKNKAKSITMPITSTEMKLEFLPKGPRRIVIQ